MVRTCNCFNRASFKAPIGLVKSRNVFGLFKSKIQKEILSDLAWNSDKCSLFFQDLCDCVNSTCNQHT